MSLGWRPYYNNLPKTLPPKSISIFLSSNSNKYPEEALLLLGSGDTVQDK